MTSRSQRSCGYKGKTAGFFLFVLIGLIPSTCAFAGYIQLDGVIDVKSRFSDGCSSVQELGALAKANGVDAVIFGDYARDSLEYGFFPFERLFKKKNENPSVLNTGAAAYLADIGDNDKQFSETLLIPGVEVAPFYYWTGSPFEKDLIANNWNKHLLVMGLDRPEDLEQLPILNSNFSKHFIGSYQGVFGGLVVLFLASLVAVYKGYYRKLTIPAAAVVFLVTVNNHPFQSSDFDQYAGDQGIQPYQDVIDYVRSKGGMVFWNHLESKFSQRVTDNIGRKTLPHAEDAVLSKGYSGLQVVTGEPSLIMEPGNEWDHVLTEYVRGERRSPAWGYGGNDFQCQDTGVHKFGMARTIFLVREKSREAVLDAIQSGRMYAEHQPSDDRLSLDEFTVSDKTTGSVGTMGEEIMVVDYPEIKVKVHTLKSGGKTAKFSIIRNGKEVKRETIALPYELNWRDVEVERSGMVYYRVNVTVDLADHIVSNPIFVRFADSAPEVASLPPEAPPAKAVPPVAPVVQTPRVPEVVQPQSPQMSEEVPPVSRVPAPVPTVSSPKPSEAPAVPRISDPVLGVPASPQTPAAPVVSSPGESFVVARIDGVSLKKGPGTVFPEVAKAKKGEQLKLVRRTTVEYNGKPWLVVEKDGHNVYVWQGLVE